MNYAEKAMQYKGKSLDDMCMMTIVTKSDLTDNDRATLVKDGWELDDEFVNEWIPQEEMTKLEVYEAYVRNQYTYTDDGDGPVYNKDCTMYCMVYADSESDDCTDTFEIKRSPYLVKEEKKHERI